MADEVEIKQRHWVYILLHWLIVGCLVMLGITGYYIHHPFFHIGSGEDNLFMTMAWIRWIHFVTAAVLIESTAVRFELAFFSHFDADWRDIGPSMKNIRALPEAISYYLFLRKDHRYWRKLNPVVATIIIPVWLIFFVIAVLTGFSMFNSQFFWGLTQTSTIVGWVPKVFGGEENMRTWHFYLIWVFACTGAVCVYLSIIRSADERDRTFRSIFSGRRLVPRKFAPIRGASGRKKQRGG